jgi:hypothetical protein
MSLSEIIEKEEKNLDLDAVLLGIYTKVKENQK